MTQAGLIELLRKLAPIAAEWAVMLLPLTVYVLWLGFSVHRRKTPLLLSGPRNTLLLAAAASGFLLVGPPTWLLAGLQGFGKPAYFGAYALYVLALLWLLRREMARNASSLVIFNLSPFDVAPLLEEALAGGPAYERSGSGQIRFLESKTRLKAEVSPWWRCCTLKLQDAPASMFAAWRGRLTAALQKRPAEESAAGAVLALAGGILLFVVTLGGMLYLWLRASFDN